LRPFRLLLRPPPFPLWLTLGEQVLLNVIIGNLMAATHYGLGLHFWTVNALDENYPHNLSKAFMVSQAQTWMDGCPGCDR
jgi:hypothetical protein